VGLNRHLILPAGSRKQFPEILEYINLLTASMAFSTAIPEGPIEIRLPAAYLTHHITCLGVFQPSERPAFKPIGGDNATHCVILVAFSDYYRHAHPENKRNTPAFHHLWS
jgi:hypothetical protein